MVFQDPLALEALNAITHKYINAAVSQRIAQAREEGRPAAAIDAIALLEGALRDFCDCTVAVVAPEEVRVRRIMAREGISEDYARLRVQAQKSSAWFAQHCDYTLENTEADSAQDFALRAKELFQRIIAQG